MSVSPYLGVILLGLLHGLEPGHGWPVAFLYSTRTNKPIFYGLVSSSIISFFHLMSSVAVVGAYILLSSVVTLPSFLMNYIAAVALVILAFIFFTEDVEDEYEKQHGHFHENQEEIEHEHEHEHSDTERHSHWHKHAKRIALSLWGIATFAFAIGFAHEEEFALLALAVGGINPLMLMIFYALSVTAALMGITLVSIKTYKRLHSKIRHYEKYVPKLSALVLLIMAVALVLGFA